MAIQRWVREEKRLIWAELRQAHLEDFAGREPLRLMLAQRTLRLGGQELQVNVVDAETLRAAKADPDSYRDPIVRVGGPIRDRSRALRYELAVGATLYAVREANGIDSASLLGRVDTILFLVARWGFLAALWQASEFMFDADQRKSDTVARYGGDKFVVIPRETSPEVSRKVAEKLRAAFTAEIPSETHLKMRQRGAARIAQGVDRSADRGRR